MKEVDVHQKNPSSLPPAAKEKLNSYVYFTLMLTVCPNCKKEFIVHDEVTGHCPECGIELIFKGEGEIIERVNIAAIEQRVDEIIGEDGWEISCEDDLPLEHLVLERDVTHIEKEIDRL